jgi:hypothetical protein
MKGLHDGDRQMRSTLIIGNTRQILSPFEQKGVYIKNIKLCNLINELIEKKQRQSYTHTM